MGQVLRPRYIRVRSYQIPATRAGEAPESSFLNSFCAEDLARVARALYRGDAGPGLLAYLTSGQQHAARERIDVRQQPQAVRAGGQPERIPLGRWPADSSRPLILSQQFAVNQIMEQLGGGRGLFAVNGPPGTGKTTMLRDVIAAIVVERALRLAELASPQDAFRDTEFGTWSTSTSEHTVAAPHPSLRTSPPRSRARPPSGRTGDRGPVTSTTSAPRPPRSTVRAPGRWSRPGSASGPIGAAS